MHNAENGIFSKVEEEPENWGNEFEFKLLLKTARDWIISGSALPATREEVLERDPLWDDNVALVRQLIQFQLDGYAKPETK